MIWSNKHAGWWHALDKIVLTLILLFLKWSYLNRAFYDYENKE
jgi:hypothetical protein